jgi:hypothetical protein
MPNWLPLVDALRTWLLISGPELLQTIDRFQHADGWKLVGCAGSLVLDSRA